MRDDLGGADRADLKASPQIPAAASAGEKTGSEQVAGAGRVHNLSNRSGPYLDAGSVLMSEGALFTARDDKCSDLRRERRKSGFEILLSGQLKRLVIIHVGSRFATDVNDVKVKGYNVVDFDLRVSLEKLTHLKSTFVQVNLQNAFNEFYFGNLSTQINNAGSPSFAVGSPRTISATLDVGF